MPEFEEDNKTNIEGINYSPRNEPKPARAEEVAVLK